MTKSLEMDNRINSGNVVFPSGCLVLCGTIEKPEGCKTQKSGKQQSHVSLNYFTLHLFSLFPVGLRVDEKRTCVRREELQNILPSPHHFTKHHFRTLFN